MDISNVTIFIFVCYYYLIHFNINALIIFEFAKFTVEFVKIIKIKIIICNSRIFDDFVEINDEISAPNAKCA